MIVQELTLLVVGRRWPATLSALSFRTVREIACPDPIRSVVTTKITIFDIVFPESRELNWWPRQMIKGFIEYEVELMLLALNVGSNNSKVRNGLRVWHSSPEICLSSLLPFSYGLYALPPLQFRSKLLQPQPGVFQWRYLFTKLIR